LWFELQRKTLCLIKIYLFNRSIDLSQARTRRQKLALGIEVLSRNQKRKSNQQAINTQINQQRKKACLYQNLVDEFGSERMSLYPKFPFFFYSL
jgi:hypothetical protein